MKSVLISSGVLAVLIITVILNSVFITNVTNKLHREIDVISAEDENAKEKLEEAEESFNRVRWIITLSVSHDDILGIEEAFAEAVGASESDDSAEFMIAKSRLCDALIHLGRLSGINFESIL